MTCHVQRNSQKREGGKKKTSYQKQQRSGNSGWHIQSTERKKKIIQLRFVYLATLSFKNEDEIIVFSNNIKREFIVSRPMLKIKYWGYLFWLNAMIRDGNSNPHERIISTNKYNNF